MLRVIAMALPLIVLGGCAGLPDQPEQQAEAKQDCEKTYTTGSHLPRKDCITPMTDAERDRLSDDLRQANTSRH